MLQICQDLQKMMIPGVKPRVPIFYHTDNFFSNKNHCSLRKSVARGRGFANLLFTQLSWRLTRSALLCYSDGYYL